MVVELAMRRTSLMHFTMLRDFVCMDRLHKEVPHATLRTDGNHVGLPEGQMGNSEVGHMNIGAGRIVYQDLLRINNAIADGSFHSEKVLLEALEIAKSEGKTSFDGTCFKGWSPFSAGASL